MLDCLHDVLYSPFFLIQKVEKLKNKGSKGFEHT